MAKGFPKVTKYVPKNPEKYQGNYNDIWSRSSWELKFMRWADTNPQVLSWSSETTIVPYFSPVDGRYHRYFVDFSLKIQSNDGSIKSYLVEVKPDAQTKPPKKPKRLTKGYVQSEATYKVNCAKWEAAIEYAKDRGQEFRLITEEHLGIK